MSFMSEENRKKVTKNKRLPYTRLAFALASIGTFLGIGVLIAGLLALSSSGGADAVVLISLGVSLFISSIFAGVLAEISWSVANRQADSESGGKDA